MKKKIAAKFFEKMQGNCQAYYKSARRLRLPVTFNVATNGFDLHLGPRVYFFYHHYTPFNNATCSKVSESKYITNRILYMANLPVPNAVEVEKKDFTPEALMEAIAGLKFPLVLKPAYGTGRGNDVICNILNFDLLLEFCHYLFKRHDLLSIEEFIGGLKSYRITVFNNKILDVIYRIPAQVIGDGQHTVEKLVEMENALREKQEYYMEPIKFNYESHVLLKRQKLTQDSVPYEGQVVRLQYTCNTSRGGTIRSISKNIDKENKKMIMKAMKVLDLAYAGMDIECEDIYLPMSKTRGFFIEANYSPSVRIHEDGESGRVVMVTRTIMRSFIFKHPISYFLSLFRFKGFKITMILILLAMLAAVGGSLYQIYA